MAARWGLEALTSVGRRRVLRFTSAAAARSGARSRLALAIWIELLGPVGRASNSSLARTHGVSLDRASPMKAVLFNLFNLVSYKLYIIIIYEFYIDR